MTPNNPLGLVPLIIYHSEPAPGERARRPGEPFGGVRRPAKQTNEVIPVLTLKIDEAINESIEKSQTVTVELPCTRGEALLAIERVWGDDWDCRHIAGGGIDVWGWSNRTPENEQQWRLTIKTAG